MPTVCVASGESLSLAQCAEVAVARRAGRCRIIVVNDNWRRIPDADILYAADRAWWRKYIGDVNLGFHGERWTVDDRAARDYGLTYVLSRAGTRLQSIKEKRIALGSNSGFQAMMLSRMLGARRIILIGYDMQGEHWFGRHPDGLANGKAETYIKYFDAVAPQLAAEGIDVANCTITTALTCFRRSTLADEFRD